MFSLGRWTQSFSDFSYFLHKFPDSKLSYRPCMPTVRIYCHQQILYSASQKLNSEGSAPAFGISISTTAVDLSQREGWGYVGVTETLDGPLSAVSTPNFAIHHIMTSIILQNCSRSTRLRCFSTAPNIWKEGKAIEFNKHWHFKKKRRSLTYQLLCKLSFIIIHR